MNSRSSGTCASEERFENVCGCSCPVSSPLKILDFIRVTVSASVGSLLLEMWPLGVASRGYGNNGVKEPDMELNIVSRVGAGVRRAHRPPKHACVRRCFVAKTSVEERRCWLI